MVKQIPGCISPDLMADMMRMGHGDELLLADADFPAVRFGKKVIRADGVAMKPLLEAILTYFPIDKAAMPFRSWHHGWELNRHRYWRMRNRCFIVTKIVL